MTDRMKDARRLVERGNSLHEPLKHTSQVDSLDQRTVKDLTDALTAALDRAERAEAALTAAPDRTVYVANHRQAHCINVTAAALGPEYATTIDGLPKAARHMRERAEKAEAYAKKTTDQYYAVCLERDAALRESVRLKNALILSRDEIDAYIRQEYPADHPVHTRYRERDFAANPARIVLEGAPGKDPTNA